MERMETHGNARKRTGARHSADGGGVRLVICLGVVVNVSG